MMNVKEKTDNVAMPLTLKEKKETLRESVRQALKNYFGQLKGEEPQEIYSMVLGEVEPPLLEMVMQHTRNNQSLTAKLLGLSRTTVRVKLKAYGLI